MTNLLIKTCLSWAIFIVTINNLSLIDCNPTSLNQSFSENVIEVDLIYSNPNPIPLPVPIPPPHVDGWNAVMTRERCPNLHHVWLEDELHILLSVFQRRAGSFSNQIKVSVRDYPVPDYNCILIIASWKLNPRSEKDEFESEITKDIIKFQDDNIKADKIKYCPPQSDFTFDDFFTAELPFLITLV